MEYRLKTVPGKRSSETQLECHVLRAGNPGRPKFLIPAETLEDLRGLGFSWEKISRMFGVSRWTIYRRVQSYGLKNVVQFSSLPDAQLDQLVLDYLNRHGRTTGRTYLAGYLMSLGLRVQRRRVRESLTRVDPVNTALRWGIVVSRGKYSVPWPNSLWNNLDGHHSLIRWGLVIHGCIDGFSRRIVFFRCSDNNLSQTVLELFLKAIRKMGFGHHVFVWIMGWRTCWSVMPWWREEVKEGEALLLVPQPEIRELKDFGGKCLDVYAIFSIMCFMQWRIQVYFRLTTLWM